MTDREFAEALQLRVKEARRLAQNHKEAEARLAAAQESVEAAARECKRIREARRREAEAMRHMVWGTEPFDRDIE